MKTIFYCMVLFSSIFLFTAFQNGKNAPVQEAEINAQNSVGSAISNINEDKWKLMQAMQSENNFSGGSSRDVNNQISICDGGVYSGVAVSQSWDNPDDWDFYVFSGNAGDVVTIRVERTGNCYMDPGFSLFFGTTNSTAGVDFLDGGPDMTFLEFQDDDGFLGCDPGIFCWSDPELVDYVLPSTGTYTLAVFDVANCAPGGEPLTYDLTITGVSCVIPTMGEWGLIILALLMLQGIWLTLAFKPQNAIIEIPKIWFQGLKHGLQDKGLMVWFAIIAVVAISLLSLTSTIQTADFFGVPLALMMVLPAVYIYKSHQHLVPVSS